MPTTTKTRSSEKPAHLFRLKENFSLIENLFVQNEYREVPDFRFQPDRLPHDHAALAALARQSAALPPMRHRHWILQDVYRSDYLAEALRLAALYGMTGIQFSGDNIYWINDSLTRYNAYVRTGELCELCHDNGLEAWFWTHEINDFFHEFTKEAQYGFYNQLVGGRLDLRSDSGYWERLNEKYDVFFQRLPGVDGIILTLNESHVPVFREDCIDSDLSASERVARVLTAVHEACSAHKKGLWVRTFCYTPEEAKNVAAGIKALPFPVQVMLKCVPADWHSFFPDDPLIAELKGVERLIEFDAAQEHMGGGRLPYPDTHVLRERFEHIRQQGAQGVACRMDRFRNHALGTLNWSNAFSFTRLAHGGTEDGTQLRRMYAECEYGPEAAAIVAGLLSDLDQVGEEVFFCEREWAFLHSHLSNLSRLEFRRGSSRAAWRPGDPEFEHTWQMLSSPTAGFLAEVQRKKQAARELLSESHRRYSEIRPLITEEQRSYWDAVYRRYDAMLGIASLQQETLLMLRGIVQKNQDIIRQYLEVVPDHLAEIRRMAKEHREEILSCGNEGRQYGPEELECFCRRAERILNEASAA